MDKNRLLRVLLSPFRLFYLEKPVPSIVFEVFYNSISFKILTVKQMILVHRKANYFGGCVKYRLVDTDQLCICL